MKKVTTILTLPIVEILEGKTIGKAQDVIINPDTKDIFLVLESTRAGNISLLSPKDIEGIGEDFILIKTVASIKKLSQYTELIQDLSSCYSIMGIKVVTNQGNIIGKIVDFELEEATGDIVTVFLDNGDSFEGTQILSICENYVFIHAEKQVETNASSETESSADSLTPSVEVQEVSEPQAGLSADEQYLVGLVLQKDIASADGEYTLAEGTTLTADIIQEAKTHELVTLLTMYAE
ncbi:MAG: PRC-barrel domain-containing protein [Lachnospiraceae bacterium]